LKVVTPSTALDAYGLMKSAIRDNDPVYLMENTLLYGDPLAASDIPDEEITIPIGTAEIKKEGKDVSLIAHGRCVIVALEAAKKFNNLGVNVRVVSMPCMEIFMSQPKNYQNKVLPAEIDNILAVEAGVGECWDKFIGKKGDKIVMKSFGLSAPGDKALNFFGFTVKNIINKVNKLIKTNR